MAKTAEKPTATRRQKDVVLDPCRVREGAQAWFVMRYDDVAKGWERCKWREGTQVHDVFPVASIPPSRERIEKVWGSGRYRLGWLDGNLASLGTSKQFQIDGAPTRPAYPNPPSAAEPSSPAPVPSPGGGAASDVASEEFLHRMSVAAGGGGAALPVPLVAVLLQQVSSQTRLTEARYEHLTQSLRLESDERIARIRADSEASIHRATLEAQAAVSRLREVSSMSPDAALAEQLGALREEIEELRESGGGDGADGGWWGEVKPLLMPVVQKALPEIPGLLQGLSARLAKGAVV